MATENLKHRTGVKIADIKNISRKKQLLMKQEEKQHTIAGVPPAVILTPILKPVKNTLTKPKEKRTDIADKKVKSLFKFLDDSGVEQPDKLLVFVRWFGLPRKLRKPETQEKLGEKIGIHKDTFANWKRRAGFWKEVSLYSNNYFLSHAPDVYYALVQYAIRTGDPSAVKLYAQRFEGWSEKIRTEDETPEKELDPELKSSISLAIKNIGLASILKNYEQSDIEETE